MFDGSSPEDILGTKARPDVTELAHALRDWAMGHIDDTATGLARDYAYAFLEPVRWTEIADNMIDAYADQYETEEESA
jgi:hypothetical protein